MKKLLTAALALILTLSLCIPALAAAKSVDTLAASGTTDTVTLSGTATGILAVMTELLDADGNSLALKSFAVSGDAFSGTITNVTLTAGATYTLRAADYDGGNWKTVTFTVPAPTSPASPASNCTLTFETNGGDALTAVSASAGTKIDLSKYVPVRKGYSFTGWYADETLTSAVASVALTKNATVYAGWKWMNPFTDAAIGSYYYDAVGWAVQNGVTDGKTDTLFAPSDTCTRAETVTFLWRAMGSPAPTGTACPFTDVSTEAYYYKAVLWAVEKDITDGTSATTFSPDATVTRAQVVTFQWRAAGKPVVNYAMFFTDVPEDAYYTEAVRWAASENITEGATATTFSPALNCTRAQIVTFLWRQLGK